MKRSAPRSSRREREFAATDALAKGLKARSVARRRAVTAQLLESFRPLIKSTAMRYRQAVIGADDMDDLEQVACVGFLEACTTYDRAKGGFSIHALWCIRGALARYVGSLENPVRLPTTLMFRLPKLRRAERKLAQTLGREPTVAELSAEVSLSEAAVAVMMNYNEGPVQLDADTGLGRPGGSLHPRRERIVDRIPCPAGSAEESLLAKEEVMAFRERKKI